MIKLAPSILSADFARLLEDVKKVEKAGCEYLHIDVMDGHFVPNITLGPAIVKSLRKDVNMVFDTHLMIENPDNYIKDFVELVSNCVKSDIEGGIYNVGNGWQVSLEEQIRGIVEVFSPKDHPSEITYVPEKPDPLENAFDASKTFKELNWKPKYSYIDQLRDFKHEMETEPFAKLFQIAVI